MASDSEPKRIRIGDNTDNTWTIDVSNGNLRFMYNGQTKLELGKDGTLAFVNNWSVQTFDHMDFFYKGVRTHRKQTDGNTKDSYNGWYCALSRVNKLQPVNTNPETNQPMHA